MSWFKSKDVSKELEQRLERLEQSFKRMEIDWSDTYDKFRRLHMRVAKQAQRVEQAEARDTAVGAEETGAPTDTQSMGLTETQRRLQAMILARRARMRGVQ